MQSLHGTSHIETSPVHALGTHLAVLVSAAGTGVEGLLRMNRKSSKSQNSNINFKNLHRHTEKRRKGSKENGMAAGRVLCTEYTRGAQRTYHSPPTSTEHQQASGFVITDEHVTHRRRVREAFADYLLPQGFPDSVAPQYAKYMGWRGVQYFFGGAMSVFTTRSLLRAVGVANKHSGEAAAAINWVVKDGAGRLGRFLFARWGRSLDCELKQFRLAGDVLMEAGAALELSTALAPRLFLPLACTANLAKNLAAVAASSTRAPIYRTFAKQNNLADVTAKGESVANLADVIGTVFGIVLAKANMPVVPTFLALSAGYLVASRREVDSVELPYLNRARLSFAARKFLSTGSLPSLKEGNAKEPLLPWADPTQGRIVLGATVAEACKGPDDFATALKAFQGRQYVLIYHPHNKTVYALLRQGIDGEGVLKAALDAHCILHMVDEGRGRATLEKDSFRYHRNGKNTSSVARLNRQAEAWGNNDTVMNFENHEDGFRDDFYSRVVDYVAQQGPKVYDEFKKQAKEEGWKLRLTMLNPLETRIHPVNF